MLTGKHILVTGILTRHSIAFSVARFAQAQGASVLATGHGRSMALTERAVRSLPEPPDVLELDVTQDHDFRALMDAVAQRWDRISFRSRYTHAEQPSASITVVGAHPKAAARDFRTTARSWLPIYRT